MYFGNGAGLARFMSAANERPGDEQQCYSDERVDDAPGSEKAGERVKYASDDGKKAKKAVEESQTVAKTNTPHWVDHEDTPASAIVDSDRIILMHIDVVNKSNCQSFQGSCLFIRNVVDGTGHAL